MNWDQVFDANYKRVMPAGDSRDALAATLRHVLERFHWSDDPGSMVACVSNETYARWESLLEKHGSPQEVGR